MSIEAFKQHNIDPLVRLINEDIRIDDRWNAERVLKAIHECILNAEAIFPDAREDIQLLRRLQTNLKGRVTSIPNDVYPTDTNVHPLEMQGFAPVGIINGLIPQHGNNCALNAWLQLFANNPILARKIQGHRNGNCKVLALLLKGIYAAQQVGRRIAPIDSQELRIELFPNTDPEQQEQLDAAEILECIQERTKNQLGRIIQFEISRNPTFTELFNTQMDKKKFEEAPEDLLIQARDAYNKDTLIEGIPEAFKLRTQDTESGQENAYYELTNCILHLGSTAKAGHIIALVKKPEGWYLMNDEQRELISDQAASDLIKKASILNYRKIDQEAFQKFDQKASQKKPSRCCGAVMGSIISLAKPLFDIAAYPFQMVRSLTGTKK